MDRIEWERNTFRNSKNDWIIDFPYEVDILRKIIKIFDQYKGKAHEYQNVRFQQEIAQKLIHEIYKIRVLTQEIFSKVMSGYRFCIVKNSHFQELSPEIRKLFVLALSSLIGTPTSTDQKMGKVIWEVTPRNDVQYEFLTFTQNNAHADFHTDTQYFSQPENMVSLWCVQPDKNHEGRNKLVDGRAVYNILQQSTEGREVYKTLSTTNFPFRVPSVFTKDASDNSIEIVYAPIFSDTPFLRYRIDTIEKALSVIKSTLTKEQTDALTLLKTVIHNTDFHFEYLLQAGDILFINNHEILHAREAFSDSNRLLYRVRMNLHSKQYDELF